MDFRYTGIFAVAKEGPLFLVVISLAQLLGSRAYMLPFNPKICPSLGIYFYFPEIHEVLH